MSKFIKTEHGTPKEILKLVNHFVAIPVTIDDTGVTPDETGHKIVPAGTILGGGILNDPSKLAVKTNDETTGAQAEGVLLYDVDVTYGPKEGALIIHGFIDLNKLSEPPHATAIEALKQITFIK